MAEFSDQVESVHIYPVKSCQSATVNGEPPIELGVGLTGIVENGVYDREWVLTDDEGQFVSQRGWPTVGTAFEHKGDRKLATVSVDIREDHLALCSLGHGRFELGIEERPGRPRGRATIHGKNLWAYDEGDEISSWFSKIIGRSVRLLRADKSRPRQIMEGQIWGASNILLGADGMPLLLTSQASLNYLHDVKGITRGTVPMSRFRPNIVIAGENLGPFGEDMVRVARIGKMIAHFIKPCARCPVPNVDQLTGKSDNMATKIMYPERYGKFAGGSHQSKSVPFFGQNLNHVSFEDVKISSGDAACIIEKSDEPNVDLTR